MLDGAHGRQRSVWGTRSGLQPQADGCGQGVDPKGGLFGPFPVDPEGERSEFREAESSRKSITLSMAEHGPRQMGRRTGVGRQVPTHCEPAKPSTSRPAEELGEPRILPHGGKAHKH
jgi:hypothetical protein